MSPQTALPGRPVAERWWLLLAQMTGTGGRRSGSQALRPRCRIPRAARPPSVPKTPPFEEGGLKKRIEPKGRGRVCVRVVAGANGEAGVSEPDC